MSIDEPTADTPDSAAASDAREPALRITTSDDFTEWLAGTKGAFAFTTYQAGKLFFVGRDADDRLSLFNRTLPRCMGLARAGRGLYVSTLYQVLRFEDGMTDGDMSGDGYDAAYVPQAAYFTGDLDVHDLAVDGLGRLLFVNTLFSCLAAVSDSASFVPVWQPSFITRLTAEDRCHLNGMALRDGALAYATAAARTDTAEGWRDQRADGGVVIDTVSGEVVCAGLSLPHSPRIHGGVLYLLDSGTGRFGRVDPAAGRFEEIAFCPGYARGLAFCGDCAVIGLSKPRQGSSFSGLALDERLGRENEAPRCGLIAIDLRSGETVAWLRLDGAVTELYDVISLPGTRNPMAIGFRTGEIRRVVSIGKPNQAVTVATG